MTHIKHMQAYAATQGESLGQYTDKQAILTEHVSTKRLLTQGKTKTCKHLAVVAWPYPLLLAAVSTQQADSRLLGNGQRGE